MDTAPDLSAPSTAGLVVGAADGESWGLITGCGDSDLDAAVDACRRPARLFVAELGLPDASGEVARLARSMSAPRDVLERSVVTMLDRLTVGAG